MLKKWGRKKKGKWKQLALEVLNGRELKNEETLDNLVVPDVELLELLNGAHTIHYHYFGNKVKLNKIINTKSGLCPENCGYCLQSSISTAPIEKYRMMDKDSILEGAKNAYQQRVSTIVSSPAAEVRVIKISIQFYLQ